MDARDLSSRLHDILRTACRVRLPGPGCTAVAAIDGIDQVKAQLRALIAELGASEPPHLPPRVRASAAAFPEGRIAGTRITVQHRRRTRVAAADDPDERRRPAADQAALVRLSDRLSPRAVAEAQFAQLSSVALEPA